MSEEQIKMVESRNGRLIFDGSVVRFVLNKSVSPLGELLATEEREVDVDLASLKEITIQKSSSLITPEIVVDIESCDASQKASAVWFDKDKEDEVRDFIEAVVTAKKQIESSAA